MASDAAQRITPSGPDLWRLPDVVSVDVARVRYSQPRSHVINHRMAPVREAIEVVVQTAAPIPVRALAPVLFIGETTLTESEPAGHLRYRFFAFAPEQLAEGAPIALGWTMSDSPRTPTQFSFRIDRDETK